MMRIRYAVAALLLGCMLIPQIAHAQKEYDIWCMGDYTGLDFRDRTAPPARISSAVNTLEGTASIADPLSGALLFYTDGVKVYNGDHRLMPNGTGLRGSDNSTQSALIVPIPGDKLRYYLFTSDAGPYADTPAVGTHYSIVDMTLDGGKGDVTTKNVRLLASATEKLTAVRHGDGCSYWVLYHGWNDNAFYAYPVTEQGLGAPVVSNVGLVHRDLPRTTPGVTTIGYIKGSPDGKRLAVAIFGLGVVEILDFDDRTGVVSNPISIPLPAEPYGLSFSPDNTKLYISCQPNSLFQLDLSSGDPTTIRASRFLVANDEDTRISDPYGALQLAPDGKIYHSRVQIRWLSAIRNPNGLGAACDYISQAIDMGVPGRLGLPNLIDGYFATGSLACGAPFASFEPSDTLICSGNCLTFTDRTTNGPTEWSWSFPGANPSSSTEQNPSGICYPAPGRYRVELIASNARGGTKWSREIVVSGRGDLKAHIDREYKVAPGERITIPLALDAPVDNAAINQLHFSVGYNAGMLRLDSIDPSKGILSGWRLDSVHYDRVNGRATGVITASPGASMQGAGTLFDLHFFAFMRRSDTSSIHFNLATPGNPCLAALSDPGLVTLEFCDARNRLIEMTSSGFALDQNAPNPFNPTTSIPYSIAFDGRVTITVYNALGERVTTLVDAELAPARYEVTWDASAYPSGLYYYRIVAGEWSSVRTMMLVK